MNVQVRWEPCLSGLSGALGALLERWGRRTGGSEGLLEALHAGNK